MAFVREPATQRPARRDIRLADGGLGAVAAVVIPQTLVNASYFAAQQMIVLRISQLAATASAGALTGLAFASAGAPATGMGAAAVAPSPAVITAATLLVGLAYGGLAIGFAAGPAAAGALAAVATPSAALTGCALVAVLTAMLIARGRSERAA